MFVACVDIGGTFTDLVLYSRDGGLEIFKSPTTPGEFERGFIDAFRLAGEAHGHGLEDFLAQVELIVNAGHPDVLTLRESPRKRAFTTNINFPPPYVARSRTAEVRGRIDAQGRELEPLNEADVVAAVRHLRQCGVQAIAVCLFWSIVNPAHERRVREIVQREWPGVPLTLSH